jgi:hypothetical protein
MQELLFKYLAQAEIVSIKGLGTFNITSIQPQYKTVEQTFTPPNQKINFVKTAETTTPNFVEYVATQKNITIEQANILINNTNKNNWIGLGEFFSDANGEKQFIEKQPYATGIEMTALKVIRKDEEHFITVGVQEKTNTEMSEFYNFEKETVQGKWWIASLIIALTTIAYLLVYFLTNNN